MFKLITKSISKLFTKPLPPELERFSEELESFDNIQGGALKAIDYVNITGKLEYFKENNPVFTREADLLLKGFAEKMIEALQEIKGMGNDDAGYFIHVYKTLCTYRDKLGIENPQLRKILGDFGDRINKEYPPHYDKVKRLYGLREGE